jgi:uncharacterized membrane protein
MNASTEPRPRSDWRLLALTASVIVNLFLAALVAGHLLRTRAYRERLPAENTPMARELARVESALPPRDAAAFGRVIEQDKPQFAAAAQELLAARRALQRQIAADPFDAHAASEALSAYRESWGRFVSDFGGPLIDALSQVSPQGRHQLVAARRKARERLLSRSSHR